MSSAASAHTAQSAVDEALDELALLDMRSLAMPEKIHELLNQLGITHTTQNADVLDQFIALLHACVQAGLPSLPVHFAQEVCADSSVVSGNAATASLLNGDALQSWAEAVCTHTEQVLLNGSKQQISQHATATRAASATAAVLNEHALNNKLDVQLVALHGAACLDQNGCGNADADADWHNDASRLLEQAESTSFLARIASEATGHTMHPAQLDYPASSCALFGLNVICQHNVPRETAVKLLLYREFHKLLFRAPAAKEHAMDNDDDVQSCVGFVDVPAHVRQLCWRLNIGFDELVLRIQIEVALDHSDATLAHSLLARRGFPSGLHDAHARAFVELDNSEAALQVARYGSATSATFLEANMRRRLLPEAFMHLSAIAESGEHVDKMAVSEETGSDMDVTKAVRLMASTAESNNQLHSLCALPFFGQAEKALLKYLRERAGTPAGEQYPMYFIRRRRYHEAAEAHREVNKAQFAGTLSAKAQEEMQEMRHKYASFCLRHSCHFYIVRSELPLGIQCLTGDGSCFVIEHWNSQRLQLMIFKAESLLG